MSMEAANTLPATLAQQISWMEAGDLSSEELVQAQALQIERLNPKLNAYVHFDVPRALEHARALDRMRRAGVVLGPMHGITVGVKDLFDVRGMPTGGGTRSSEPTLPELSATVVQRLERAGAIVLGKTQTVEYAFGGWGTNAVMGTPWNPWDLDVHRVPGGSSSGSAVAVAAGMASAAIGSDTGGSVRIPAGLCGLTGLKTSPGLLSRAGLMALCPTHDTVGPIARTAADCARLLDAMTGPDNADPGTGMQQQTRTIETLRQSPRSLRYWSIPHSEQIFACTAQMEACMRVQEILDNLGLLAVHQDMPCSCLDAVRIAGQLMSAEAYSSMGPHVEREDVLFDPHVRKRILLGKEISASHYLWLLGERRKLVAKMNQAFARADILVFPTNTITAIPVDEVDESQYPLSIYGRFVNLMDLCSLAIPAGLDDQGLPLSVQLIAPAGQEALVLSVGHAIQSVTDWHQLKPNNVFDIAT